MSKHNGHNHNQNSNITAGSTSDATNKIATATVEAIKEAGNVLTPRELQAIIDDMKKGQATKNKILDWLLSNVVIQFLRPLLFHLSDVCEPREMAQCIDYMMLKMPRDAAYVESYRAQMIELVEARIKTAEVKSQSLAELAAQG